MPSKKPTGPRSGVITPDDFWTVRPMLAALHQFARARMVGPWAMLGIVLVRAVTVVPPSVVLPPIVGSHASLNQFVALVGSSSGGKGAANSAARDFLDVTPEPYARPLGSGEGLVKSYAHKQKGIQYNDRWSVLFTVPEVDTLTALGARQGATLLPQLRSAWSGEQLGHSYSDDAKGVVLEDHRYRLALTLGVQPHRAGPLLNDADGGTPQRFIWMPTADPGAPDDAPEEPEPWSLPAWQAEKPDAPTHLLDTPAKAKHFVQVELPPEVVEFIRASRRDDLRSGDATLGAHSVLTREKVAAAFMVLDGRRDKVSSEDWDLAGVVMEVSERTRAEVAAALAERERESAQARGRSDAVRNRAAQDETTRADIVRAQVEAAIGRHLSVAGELSKRDLRKKQKLERREVFDSVFNDMKKAGDFSHRTEGKSVLYRFPEDS